ncbi:hypothetical protein B0J11DRAFT_522504 [Dendryphion nanum]|uniref:Fungal N-terminal domain-containing protein n=1 Tax=Dendryphion nanum TaxID=256645 RepID=A0A9P9E3M7_9PLEO|nr:hypothetical protein B0J11DRAFT_522504 [Dendryphion nanum]
MAEVAGVVVGFTSLGVQICQGINSFYGPFKSFHDDIDAIVIRVEGLQASLEALQSVRNRLDRPSTIVDAQLNDAINSCARQLERVDLTRKKYGDVRLPETWEDKARIARKRLLWPFKKDALTELQTNLDRLQSNLQVALDILGLDNHIQTHEQLQDLSGTLIFGMSSVHNQLSICDSSMRSAVAHSTRSLQQNNADIEERLSNKFDAGVTTILNTLNLLVAENGQMRYPENIPPNLLAESIHVRDEVNNLRRHIPQETILPSRNTTQSSPQSLLGCKCSLRRRSRKTVKYGRFLTTLIGETSDHDPGCALYPYSKFRRTVEQQFRICNRILSVCVRVGYAHAQEAGWRTIHPTLRIRPVVSRDSPGFQLIDFALRDSREQKLSSLQDLFAQLIDCFHQKFASPLDVLSDGTTLMHITCGWLPKWITSGYIDLMSAIGFLNHLGAVGVPFDQEDDNEWLPFNCLLESVTFYSRIIVYSRLELLSHVIRRAGIWKVVETGTTELMPEKAYETASALLSIDEANECFEDDDRRSLPSSVVRRDLSEWSSTLKMHHDLVPNEGLIRSLLNWTDGLHLFLSLRLKIDPKLEALALTLAIGESNSEAVTLLVKSGFKIDNTVWEYLCDEAWLLDPYNRRSIFSVVLDRIFSVVLESMNLLRPECTHTDSCTQSVCKVSKDHEFQPYTYPLIPPTAMQYAWNAGYRNVDDIWHDETPLWHFLAAYLFEDNYTPYPFSMLDKIYWFVDHGAQLDWIHPTYGTTPAHLIAKVGRYVKSCNQFRRPGITNKKFLFKSLQIDIQDNCNCPCSIKGCYTFTCAVLSTLRYEIRYERRRLLRELIVFANNERHCRSWMVPTLIRAITFEELGLTHTCCSRISDDEQGHRKSIHYRCRHLPSDEIRDQHHIESEDIALLEALMGEFFESWLTFNVTLQQYIDTLWTDRMDEVRPMDSGISEEDKDVIEQLGVQLLESFSDDEEFEPDSEDDRLRYWRLVKQYPRSVRLLLTDEYHPYDKGFDPDSNDHPFRYWSLFWQHPGSMRRILTEEYDCEDSC